MPKSFSCIFQRVSQINKATARPLLLYCPENLASAMKRAKYLNEESFFISFSIVVISPKGVF